MGLIREDAEGAINSFVEDQKKEPGRCTLRLAQFDDSYEDVFKSSDIQTVKKYILVPRGMTALTDGIGKVVSDFGAELAALPEDERPGNVVVVIVTDGGENSSREYTIERVNEIITEQQDKYNWKFLFLAAGQDAIATGAGYGLGAASTITYTTDNYAGTVSTASSLVTNLRSTGTFRGFSDEDRENAVK
jgi:hypothetical protein